LAKLALTSRQPAKTDDDNEGDGRLRGIFGKALEARQRIHEPHAKTPGTRIMKHVRRVHVEQSGSLHRLRIVLFGASASLLPPGGYGYGFGYVHQSTDPVGAREARFEL
jgi:hypothetical protein